MPRGVEPPCAGIARALASEPRAHAVGGDRGADIDEDRIAVGRNADGERIGGEDGAAAAEGRDADIGRIRAGDDGEAAAVGATPQEGGEATDVMAAPDGDRRHAVARGALDGEIDGARRQPHAGQRLAIPGHRGAAISHHIRLAARRHGTAGELLEIGRREVQPVRRVPERIGLDEKLGDDGGFIRLQAARREQGGGEADQLGDAIARDILHDAALPCSGERCDMCQGMRRCSANSTAPKRARPSAASTMMMAKARSMRRSPVAIWM